MAWAAAIPAAIQAAGSITSGVLSNRNKETKTQKTQRHLIDKLISSLSGQGPYADLYKTDYDAFKKSYVDPAKSMFNNQIAPQIQQQSIASGQQRGTGLDDQLLRAGVDLDQLLNQAYMEHIQGAQNRKQSTINSILGMGAGAEPGMSTGQAAAQSTAGYLSSDAFSNSAANIYKEYNKPVDKPIESTRLRRGFEKPLGET